MHKLSKTASKCHKTVLLNLLKSTGSHNSKSKNEDQQKHRKSFAKIDGAFNKIKTQVTSATS